MMVKKINKGLGESLQMNREIVNNTIDTGGCTTMKQLFSAQEYCTFLKLYESLIYGSGQSTGIRKK